MRAAVFLDGKLGRRRGQLNALGGLVYLQDDKSKQKFLVDTGAAVSVLPHKETVFPPVQHSQVLMAKPFRRGAA
jgi:hypothetical protein